MNNELGKGIYFRDVIAAIIAVIFTGTSAALVLMDRQVPQEFWALLGLVVGFYFGVATQAKVRK